jgi:hypothetical protein
MNIPDRLKAGGQSPELGSLCCLRVRTFENREDSLRSLRIRRIEVGHLGIELSPRCLAFDVERGALRIPITGTVDVVENSVRIRT